LIEAADKMLLTTSTNTHELLRQVKKFIPPLLEKMHKGTTVPHPAPRI
jgi:hypothetical protein